MSLAAMVLADRGDRLSGVYDRWIGVITLGGADRVREAVLREIAPGERLLDVGCGTGTLAVGAARRGSWVVAVDRSGSMLALAREKAGRAGVTVEWREGDVAFPPVGDDRFDVATATFVLSELSRELAALAIRRMAEAIRPGGRLIIADEASPTSPVLRALGALPRALLRLVSFFFLQQLAPTRRHPWRTLLQEAGLEVTGEHAYGSGSLVVLTATRPRDLPAWRRPVRALDEVLPAGASRGLLRAAAWLDLPVAVTPGVYRIGNPDRGAPVLLTGNFLASVEAVRAGMGDRDAYLAVEDTDGWNVWCAGDAGLFTAEKAAALLELHDLAGLVDVRRIIVPRLGGRVRPRLAALTGWEVAIGPIEARDLPTFLDAGIAPGMRSLDRLYRLPERVRVGALTLVQLPVFLLPLRFLPSAARRPAWRFALAAGGVLPLVHYRLPGRTGIAKGTLMGAVVAGAGTATGRLRPVSAVVLLATAPLVGWVYQSSSPVVFWKRVWR
jgi:ubiquinone/menaquinone biosynthesis C-methylase UbiE